MVIDFKTDDRGLRERCLDKALAMSTPMDAAARAVDANRVLAVAEKFYEWITTSDAP